MEDIIKQKIKELESENRGKLAKLSLPDLEFLEIVDFIEFTDDTTFYLERGFENIKNKQLKNKKLDEPIEFHGDSINYLKGDYRNKQLYVPIGRNEDSLTQHSFNSWFTTRKYRHISLLLPTSLMIKGYYNTAIFEAYASAEFESGIGAKLLSDTLEPYYGWAAIEFLITLIPSQNIDLIKSCSQWIYQGLNNKRYFQNHPEIGISYAVGWALSFCNLILKDNIDLEKNIERISKSKKTMEYKNLEELLQAFLNRDPQSIEKNLILMGKRFQTLKKETYYFGIKTIPLEILSYLYLAKLHEIPINEDAVLLSKDVDLSPYIWREPIFGALNYKWQDNMKAPPKVQMFKNEKCELETRGKIFGDVEFSIKVETINGIDNIYHLNTQQQYDILMEAHNIENLKKYAFNKLKGNLIYKLKYDKKFIKKMRKKLEGDYEKTMSIATHIDITFEDFIKKYTEIQMDDPDLKGKALKKELFEKNLTETYGFSEDWKFDVFSITTEINTIIEPYNVMFEVLDVNYQDIGQGDIKGKYSKHEFKFKFNDLDEIMYIYNKFLKKENIMFVGVKTGADYYEYFLMLIADYEKIKAEYKKRFYNPENRIRKSTRKKLDKQVNID